MKQFLKIFLTLAISVAGIEVLHAQELLWNIDFDFRFDNREYGKGDDTMVALSQTLFGAFLTPQIGIGWGRNNSLMTGISCSSDFGSKTFMRTPEFIAYFNHESERFKVTAGIFPRKKMLGQYSYAFFSDSTRFYDANLEGILLQYVRPNWLMEVGCDWNSMTSTNNREKFMLFLSSRTWKGMSYAGYTATMYHHAGSRTVYGVVDNILMDMYLGIDLAKRFRYEKLYMQLAWVQAFQNDRKYVGEFVFPGGMEFDMGAEYKSLGFRNTLYMGENLMPYYDSPYEDDAGSPYADGLYFGDTFYRTDAEKKIYERFEFYYEPTLRNGIKMRLGSVHHYDGKRWGWQQTVSLSVDIGNHMFRRKPAE